MRFNIWYVSLVFISNLNCCVHCSAKIKGVINFRQTTFLYSLHGQQWHLKGLSELGFSTELRLYVKNIASSICSLLRIWSLHVLKFQVLYSSLFVILSVKRIITPSVFTVGHNWETGKFRTILVLNMQKRNPTCLYVIHIKKTKILSRMPPFPLCWKKWYILFY